MCVYFLVYILNLHTSLYEVYNVFPKIHLSKNVAPCLLLQKALRVFYTYTNTYIRIASSFASPCLFYLSKWRYSFPKHLAPRSICSFKTHFTLRIIYNILAELRDDNTTTGAKNETPKNFPIDAAYCEFSAPLTTRTG